MCSVKKIELCGVCIIFLIRCQHSNIQTELEIAIEKILDAGFWNSDFGLKRFSRGGAAKNIETMF